MLECQRPRFQLPSDLHYLNCAYMAPLAREVEAAGREGMARRRDPSTIVADDFFDQVDALRERFARLIGGSEERGTLGLSELRARTRAGPAAEPR